MHALQESEESITPTLSNEATLLAKEGPVAGLDPNDSIEPTDEILRESCRFGMHALQESEESITPTLSNEAMLLAEEGPVASLDPTGSIEPTGDILQEPCRVGMACNAAAATITECAVGLQEMWMLRFHHRKELLVAP